MASVDEILLWKTQLAEAELAYHKLLTTGATTMLKHGDKEIQTSNPKPEALAAYIATLKQKLIDAGETGITGGRGRARRFFA